MTTLVDELSQKALELPAEERVLLAERLLATVHEVDPEVEAAWDVEIQRRLAEIDRGTAKLIPAAEVFAKVRSLLK
jgi:putative addiction module component (TIGR02574 family)